MTVLKWWFVTVPVWGWHLVGPHWKSLGGLVLLALMALAYATVTLLAVGCLYRLLAWLGKRVGRGAIQGARKARAEREGP